MVLRIQREPVAVPSVPLMQHALGETGQPFRATVGIIR